eukprot:scaffold67346_cov19-Tisochrysis_lutea.AAC.1
MSALAHLPYSTSVWQELSATKRSKAQCNQQQSPFLHLMSCALSKLGINELEWIATEMSATSKNMSRLDMALHAPRKRSLKWRAGSTMTLYLRNSGQSKYHQATGGNKKSNVLANTSNLPHPGILVPD